MKDFLKDVKKILYPENLTCSVCGRENFNGKYFCDECENSLPKNNGIVCDHCGRRTVYPTSYCNYCKDRHINFDCARSSFEYKEPINQLIRRLKYYGDRYLAGEIAEYLKKTYFWSMPIADCVVCVPSSAERMKLRGYNQSFLLAKEFAKLVDLPFYDDVIQKTVDTISQVGLSRKERKENLKGSFKITQKDKIKGKKVLIIDDVMTTGTTVDVLAERLKNAGAMEVYALTVASITFEKVENNN